MAAMLREAEEQGRRLAREQQQQDEEVKISSSIGGGQSSRRKKSSQSDGGRMSRAASAPFVQHDEQAAAANQPEPASEVPSQAVEMQLEPVPASVAVPEPEPALCVPPEAEAHQAVEQQPSMVEQPSQELAAPEQPLEPAPLVPLEVQQQEPSGDSHQAVEQPEPTLAAPEIALEAPGPAEPSPPAPSEVPATEAKSPRPANNAKRVVGHRGGLGTAVPGHRAVQKRSVSPNPRALRVRDSAHSGRGSHKQQQQQQELSPSAVSSSSEPPSSSSASPAATATVEQQAVRRTQSPGSYPNVRESRLGSEDSGRQRRSHRRRGERIESSEEIVASSKGGGIGVVVDKSSSSSSVPGGESSLCLNQEDRPRKLSSMDEALLTQSAPLLQPEKIKGSFSRLPQLPESTTSEPALGSEPTPFLAERRSICDDDIYSFINGAPPWSMMNSGSAPRAAIASAETMQSVVSLTLPMQAQTMPDLTNIVQDAIRRDSRSSVMSFDAGEDQDQDLLESPKSGFRGLKKLGQGRAKECKQCRQPFNGFGAICTSCRFGPRSQ